MSFAMAAMLAEAQCIFRKDPVLKASSLFLAGWLLSGIAAFALLSAAYPHYALVMAPMGCLIVGYAVRGNIPGYAMLAYILNLSLDNLGLYARRLTANALLAPQYSGMAKDIAPHVQRKRCLHMTHWPFLL